MKEPVPIALRGKRGGLDLLHHHHEHNQEDGKSRSYDTYCADDGVLAQLRQSLVNVLFYHIMSFKMS